MNVYYATFSGSYLGGHAVIEAGDEQHALDLLRADSRFKALPEKQQQDIEIVECQRRPVVYFWDGDY